MVKPNMPYNPGKANRPKREGLRSGPGGTMVSQSQYKAMTTKARPTATKSPVRRAMDSGTSGATRRALGKSRGG